MSTYINEPIYNNDTTTNANTEIFHDQAKHDHGRIEWIGGTAPLEAGHIVIMLEETDAPETGQITQGQPDGVIVASLSHHWPEKSRGNLLRKFLNTLCQ